MLDTNQLHGLYIPIVTPFLPNYQLDLTSYERYLRTLIQEDVHGLVINGTTGESPTMPWEDIVPLVQVTRELLLARSSSVPIIIGTGTNDTISSVRRTELAGRMGADAALVVVPYYNRPSQEGIYEHFRQVASVGVPIILYEIPSRTGVTLTVDTIRRIMELDGVIGMKDSTGGTELLTELMKYDTKPILCGDDQFFYEKLCLGAAGGILASANVNTRIYLDVWQQYTDGNLRAAEQTFEQLTPMIQLLFKEPNPAPIKWILAQQGIIDYDQLRLPMSPISTELRKEIEEALRQ